MSKRAYRSMPPENAVGRRDFLKAGGAIGAGLVMSGRSLFAAQQTQGQQPPAKPAGPPPRPKTNIEDALKVPRTKWSLPGPFPGRVIEVHDPAAMPDGKVDAAVVKAMFEKGIRELTGQEPQEELRPVLHQEGHRRPQGQPGRARPHQHPARGGRRRHRLADVLRPAAQEHHHLGPLRLHAQGRRLHGRALPGHRHRGPADDGRGGGRGQDPGQQQVAQPRRHPRQRAQLRPGGLLLGRRRRAQGPALPQPARLQRQVLLLRQAADQEADQDRQPARVQEHRQRHLHGHQEHRLRRRLQHEPAARAPRS